MSMQFHYLCRGIIEVEGMVLLAHQIGAAHTFLPGGHIDLGESAETALIREIREETGKVAAISYFIGAVEAGWKEEGMTHHEINLVFQAEMAGVDNKEPIKSLESHIEFLWADIQHLESHNLLPKAMIRCLLTWQKSNGAFWGSEFRV
jgi:8-oxo-dGTP diphosphatase